MKSPVQCRRAASTPGSTDTCNPRFRLGFLPEHPRIPIPIEIEASCDSVASGKTRCGPRAGRSSIGRRVEPLPALVTHLSDLTQQPLLNRLMEP